MRIYLSFLLLIVFPALPSAATSEEGIPIGFALQYSENFEKAESTDAFEFSDPSAWRIADTNGNKALELAKQSIYKPVHRSPFNIALLRGMEIKGDFILEADLLQTGKEYGHRDMCLFFGFQDPNHFYYAHVATKTDDHAHNIFIVNDKPRSKISDQTTSGVNWGLNVWHKVRITRIGKRIQVYFDDLKTPIMSAEDDSFRNGSIGFGSFDDTGMIDHIKLWTPAAEPPGKREQTVFGESVSR